MGIMVIDALQEKPCNYAPTDSLFFLVVYGKIEVCIHNSSWIIETDGSFVVPLGNIYRIKTSDKTKLNSSFYHQGNSTSRRVGGMS
ncbi:centromere protein C-like [Tachypleus tridentatus]|uniref:centromere protein C-like n=1 Tax=Tachypleus tridentatus TaxID=6853 RepID=UPI003FD3E977